MMAKPVSSGYSNHLQPRGDAQILSAVELELALGRAQRRSAGGSRKLLVRLFSVLLLLGLLAAGLGAMWYVQSVAAQHGGSHSRAQSSQVLPAR